MIHSVTGKIGNMRKSVDWVVYPVQDPDERTIQSDKRIARVNLQTGKVTLSDGKGGHQGFYKLNLHMGAKEYDCPKEILDQLRETPVQTGPIQITGNYR